MFTVTDVNTKEHSFFLGITDSHDKLLGKVLCTFIDGVSMQDSEIDDRVVRRQRSHLKDCMGYAPNMVCVTLPKLDITDFVDIMEQLMKTVDYALITYFQLIIPDLYICIDLLDTEVDMLKLKGFDEAVGFDLYADEQLLVLSRVY